MGRRAGRFFLVALALVLALRAASPAAAQQPATPTPDPLATPTLPEHPTAVDRGRYAYYFDCMPCHGDRGQGLTDAWRATWVDDHQDCWGRGCHAGRPGDEGFPLPTAIPAIIGAPGGLAYSEAALVRYLRATHPPQRPGELPAEEYEALAAFLLAENGAAAEPQGGRPTTAALLAVVCLTGLLGWAIWRGRQV